MEKSLDQQGRPYRRWWFVVTLLAGTFTMSISQSSLSTVYPTLMRYFGISAATVQWLTTGFMLVMCVTMPMSPWLLKNMGFRRLFISILAIFDLGTLIVVLAPTFWMMMVGRIMEAVAVGVLFPSFQSVLLTITPQAHRGKTMGGAGLVMGSALACGPIISGIVLQWFAWRGLFVIFMLVITVVMVLAMAGMIRDVMPLTPSSLDFLSVVLSVGLVGILYVVTQIGREGVNWLANGILLLVSLIAVAWFVVRQGHRKQPLLELRVLKTLNFTLSVLLTGLSYVALIVATVILPLYYQQVLGVSPLISGLALVPAAALLSALNPLTGKLADRFGYRPVMLTGMSLIVAGWLLATIFVASRSLWLMIGCAMIIEGGNAFVMMPAVTMGANALPDQLVPHGTAVTTTIRQILGATGVAVATLVLTVISQHQQRAGATLNVAQLGGFQVTFGLMLGLALVGLALALCLKDRQSRTA